MKEAGKYIDELAFEGKPPLAGDYVRSRRKILNLTLNELAEITGIDETNLSSYENNKKEIGLKVSIKLGAALGLNPSIILDCSIREEMKTPEVKEILLKAKKMIKAKTKSA